MLSSSDRRTQHYNYLTYYPESWRSVYLPSSAAASRNHLRQCGIATIAHTGTAVLLTLLSNLLYCKPVALYYGQYSLICRRLADGRGWPDRASVGVACQLAPINQSPIGKFEGIQR